MNKKSLIQDGERMKKQKKTKRGAASFYIVAISSLILMVVTVSFATMIASEMERTTNNDLSQSAYDSALAGVEDAKLAFARYEECRNNSSAYPTCASIINMMQAKYENGEYKDGNGKVYKECDMVANVLGKVTGENGVMIRETQANTGGASNNMQEYYTCNKITRELTDYKATLSSSRPTKVIKAKFDVDAKAVNRFKISWFQTKIDSDVSYQNFLSNRVVFPQIGAQRVSAPPTISVGVVQTASSFSMADLEGTKTVSGGAERVTDRGTVFLVPADSSNSSVEIKPAGDGVTYVSGWDSNRGENYLTAEALLKSNDKQSENLPYVVKCDKGSDYYCSVTIELPKPVGRDGAGNIIAGERSEETFLFVVSIPYGAPQTGFQMEFYCNGDCPTKSGETKSMATLSTTQVEVDATGRANDVYRRVIVRLESTADTSFLSLMGPMELYNKTSGIALKKNISVAGDMSEVERLR